MAAEGVRSARLGTERSVQEIVRSDAIPTRAPLDRENPGFQPGDFGEIRGVYGADPDGNIVEIQAILNAGHAFAFPPRARRDA